MTLLREECKKMENSKSLFCVEYDITSKKAGDELCQAQLKLVLVLGLFCFRLNDIFSSYLYDLLYFTICPSAKLLLCLNHPTSLPICHPTYQPESLTINLPTCLPNCKPAYLATWLPDYGLLANLPTCLPAIKPNCLLTDLSTFKSAYLPTCLPGDQSTC